ncbi:MAG: condensation domain-containing protein, partial [Ferruginibacter sp.]
MERKFLYLHPAQRDVYTDQLINAGSAHYNIGGYIRLKGHLNKVEFHETIRSIPDVFDAFKLRFAQDANGPVCFLDEDFTGVNLTEMDFSGY